MRKIYAVIDRMASDLVGNGGLVLMTFKTEQQAIRYFWDAVVDTSSILNKHPEDYDLLHLGDVNDDGEITPARPNVVITAKAIIAGSTQHNGPQEVK